MNKTIIVLVTLFSFGCALEVSSADRIKLDPQTEEAIQIAQTLCVLPPLDIPEEDRAAEYASYRECIMNIMPQIVEKIRSSHGGK